MIVSTCCFFIHLEYVFQLIWSNFYSLTIIGFLHFTFTISRSWLWLNLALRLIISMFALWIANVNLLLRKRKWLRIHIMKSFFVVQQTYFHMSISPTFYEQLFCTKVFRAAYLYLRLRFVDFWQKEIGAKAALKMLVKLSPG